jgi:hypothetical protein
MARHQIRSRASPRRRRRGVSIVSRTGAWWIAMIVFCLLFWVAVYLAAGAPSPW